MSPLRQPLQPGTAAKELANDLLPVKNFPLALRSGVKIAFGSDIGEGDHATEFRLMIAAGMSPLEALFTATRNAAELIGAANDIGSIQPGRYADLVATMGNPLSNPAQFGKIDFVMKGGEIYRANGSPTPQP
ncbi:MAG: amidohydrolase family protein [Sphingomonadales bacterium]|nr:amidohydrolase family protein [Sphingomonadales bacterium]